MTDSNQDQGKTAAGGTETSGASSSSASSIQDALAAKGQAGAGNDGKGADGKGADAGGKSASGASGSDAGGAGKASRPDFLDESDWDAEAGAAKLDRLAADAKAGREARAAAEERAKGRPEKPDGYKLELPKDWTPGEGLTLPDGFELNKDDPLFKAGAAWAHENGLTQDQFSKLVAMKVGQEFADAEAMKGAMRRQYEALGEKAAERTGAVKAFVTNILPEKQASALLSMILTAAQVEAFEALAAKIANGGAAGFGAGDIKGGQSKELTDEQRERMTPAERLVFARTGKLPEAA